MNREAVRIESISLNFPSTGREVLRNISWTILGGERWILFGRNGSGKTKLLEIVCGYLHQSEGAVRRFGLDRCDIRELRKRIGYVGTSLKETFYPHEKVIDVVLSGIDATIGLYRDMGAEETRKARQLLEAADMSYLADASFGTLSDGEKQRVLMLRAVICEPDILILDEPAEGLDLAAREDMLGTVERLASLKRAAVIYVTHHVEEITPIFTRLFILHKGECLYSGELRSGLTGDMLSRVFDRRVAVEQRGQRFYAVVVP